MNIRFVVLFATLFFTVQSALCMEYKNNIPKYEGEDLPLEILPDEILVLVNEYLSQHDLQILARTNNRFRALVNYENTQRQKKKSKPKYCSKDELYQYDNSWSFNFIH
jgi:hypothetical protein